MQVKDMLFAAAAFAGLVAAQKSELTPDAVKQSIITITNISDDTNDVLTNLKPLNFVSLLPVRSPS